MQFKRAFVLNLKVQPTKDSFGVGVSEHLVFASEYSAQRCRDSRSIGLNFQRFIGVLMRPKKRFSCSSSETENQYLSKIMPERCSILSNSGQERRNSSYSSGVQKPMTFRRLRGYTNCGQTRRFHRRMAGARHNVESTIVSFLFSRAGNATTRQTR